MHVALRIDRDLWLDTARRLFSLTSAWANEQQTNASDGVSKIRNMVHTHGKANTGEHDEEYCKVVELWSIKHWSQMPFQDHNINEENRLVEVHMQLDHASVVAARFALAGCSNKPAAAIRKAWSWLQTRARDPQTRSPNAAGAGGNVADEQPSRRKAAQPRKFAHRGHASDHRRFHESQEALDATIKDEADLANSEINNRQHRQKRTWRIRVPVENFQTFRKAVLKIGEVEKNTVDSEDMTDKYYDLEAHIKNRMAAREAMRDLLKETGKRDMEQYLKVYDKLELINDEINRKEGQLRLWANLTDLTTVTVHLREKQKYVAEKGLEPVERPTSALAPGYAVVESWGLFVAFWQWVVIVVIALAPWCDSARRARHRRLVVAASAWR